MLRVAVAAHARRRRLELAGGVVSWRPPGALFRPPPPPLARPFASKRRPPRLPPLVEGSAQASLDRLSWSSLKAAVAGRLPHARPPPAPRSAPTTAPGVLAALPARLPAWVRARLFPVPPSGWAPSAGRWLPAEWTIRPAFPARRAILCGLNQTEAGRFVQAALPAAVGRAVALPTTTLALPAPPRPAPPPPPDPAGPGGRLAILMLALAAGGSAARGVHRALLAAWRAAALAGRSLYLAALFTPVLASAASALDHPVGHPARAAWTERLRTCLERAGPAFIKWGQWAATRADLFPPDVCGELERLHSHAPAHPRRVTEDAIRDAFGAGIEDLFDDFPDDPVASGSIGQVYRATLSPLGARRAGLDPGTPVAVKVRHPGVEDAIARDFAIMMAAVKAAVALSPALAAARADETLAQFEAPLREQVDLGREAVHLHQFGYNFRARPAVRFPQPVYPLVSEAVLVETFEDGSPIGPYVEEGPSGPYGTALAELGTRTVISMLLIDNYVHADLHPGNMLVTLDPPTSGPRGLAIRGVHALRVALGLAAGRSAPDASWCPTSWLVPSLVLLDVGMTSRLSEADQARMVALFTAFARGDGAGVAQNALTFAEGRAQTCTDPAAFEGDMAAYFRALDAERERIAATGAPPLDGGKALAGVLELVRTHRVALPGVVASILVAVLVLEGWSSRLDPHYSPIEAVEALVAPETTRLGKVAARVMAHLDDAGGMDARLDEW